MKFTDELLLLIQEIGEFLPRLETKHMYISRLRRNAMYGSLRRLEHKGLIKKTKSGQIISYKITKKGNETAKKIVFPERRSDGLSTVIIFDIPETHHRHRKALRRFLLSREFTQLQKSVFISPNKMGNDLREYINDLKIDQFVTVLLSKIVHDKTLV